MPVDPYSVVRIVDFQVLFRGCSSLGGANRMPPTVGPAEIVDKAKQEVRKKL